MPDWRWFHQLILRLRTLFQRDRVERELAEEFQFHIEQRTALEIAKGLSPAEARSVALRAMDGMEQRKEECLLFEVRPNDPMVYLPLRFCWA